MGFQEIITAELFIRGTSNDQWKKLLDCYVTAAQKAGDSVRLLTQKGPRQFQIGFPHCRGASLRISSATSRRSEARHSGPRGWQLAGLLQLATRNRRSSDRSSLSARGE